MASEYAVQRIVEMARVAETGGLEKYYRHTIKTKGGVILTVDIDEKNFTPELAIPILTKKATEVDAIKKS